MKIQKKIIVEEHVVHPPPYYKDELFIHIVTNIRLINPLKEWIGKKNKELNFNNLTLNDILKLIPKKDKSKIYGIGKLYKVLIYLNDNLHDR